MIYGIYDVKVKSITMLKKSLVRWLKTALVVLIVVLWVVCCCLLCLSSWIRDNLNPAVVVVGGTPVGDFYLHSFFPVVFPVLIVSSFLLLVIGFLGCCGACTENKALLAWFFVAVLVAFCVEISAGVWGRLRWNLQYKQGDVDLIYGNIKKLAIHDQKWFRNTWIEIHSKFRCCGVRSINDWDDAPEIQASCLSYRSQNGSSENMMGCGELLLKYLTESGPIRAMPYLATANGTIQILCLIITVKLWMILCFGGNPKSPEINQIQANQTHQQNDISSTTGQISVESRSKVPPVPSSPGRSAQKITMYPVGQHVDFQNRNFPHCRQCAMQAYEETRLMTSSMLEVEYGELFERPRAERYLRAPNHRRVEGITMSSPCSHVHNQWALSTRNLRIPESASCGIPTKRQSSSCSSIRQCSRNCHSAVLPRRKLSHRSPKWRHRSPRPFVARLSTIRASGIAVESDTTPGSDCSQNVEELGGSRCYNTEAESSFSGAEDYCRGSTKSSRRLREDSASGFIVNRGDCPTDSTSTKFTVVYPTL